MALFLALLSLPAAAAAASEKPITTETAGPAFIQAWSFVVEVDAAGDGTTATAHGRHSETPITGDTSAVLNAAVQALPHHGGTIPTADTDIPPSPPRSKGK